MVCQRLVLLILPSVAITLTLGSLAPAAAQNAASDPSAVIYLDEPEAAPRPMVVTSGKVADKYADGKVRIEREVLKLSDDQLVNNGQFTEYYPNGQKFAEGRYANGVHDGAWSFWFDNGQLCKTVAFKSGLADGAWEVFRADGTLLAKKSYKNNLRDGNWVTFQSDGKTPKVEEAFVNGQREGVSRAYFANGKVQREVSFKHGMLDGLTTEWDEAGRKIGEVNFKENMRHGRYLRFNADGTTLEQNYDSGRLLTNASGG